MELLTLVCFLVQLNRNLTKFGIVLCDQPRVFQKRPGETNVRVTI